MRQKKQADPMAALLLALVLLSSCAAPTAVMVHPANGEAIVCKTWAVGIFRPITALISNARCVDQARSAGFVKASEYGRYNRDYWHNPYRGWER